MEINLIEKELIKTLRVQNGGSALDTMSGINSKGLKRGPINELLIRNYP